MKSSLVLAALLFGCATAKVVTAPQASVGIKATDEVRLSPSTDREPKHVKSYPDGRVANTFLACVSHGLSETVCICTLWEFTERYSFEDVQGMTDEVRGETFTSLLKACYEAENGKKVTGI